MPALPKLRSKIMNAYNQPNYGGIITPHDTSPSGAPGPRFFISFATAGDIVAETEAGDTLTIPSGALAAGIVHPIAFRRIKGATTAEGICYWR